MTIAAVNPKDMAIAFQDIERRRIALEMTQETLSDVMGITSVTYRTWRDKGFLIGDAITLIKALRYLNQQEGKPIDADCETITHGV